MVADNERLHCDHSVCLRVYVGMIRPWCGAQSLTLPSALKVNGIHQLCWGPALGMRQNGWKIASLFLSAEIKICAVTSLSHMKT